MVLRFEWDVAKEAANFAKHGVGFARAAAAFGDSRLVLAEDAEHSDRERRYFGFGIVEGGVLTVRFTVRGDSIRLIGAGYWRRGRDYYEKANHLFG